MAKKSKKKSVAKRVVKAAKKVAKKAKKHNLSAEGRKRLSEMMKKRWAERKRKIA